MNQTAKGYLLGALAAATYGMNPLFALPLYAHGMGPASVLFFRYLFAIPILALMLQFRRGDFRLRRRETGLLVCYGVLFALSSLTLFESYRYMDAGIASTLLFVYPLLVALIMAARFGERLSLSTILCLGVALGGIALLYKGADGATLSLTGTLLVGGSALSYAIYIVGVNRPRLQQVPTLKITFYVTLFGLLLFAAMLFGEPDSGASAGWLPGLQLPDRWYLWLNCVALGLFPTALSLLCTTAAIHCIGSTPTAILGVLEPVTALFFGVTVFGEQLTPRDLTGIVLIFAAVGWVVASGSRGHYLVRLRKLFPKLRRTRRGNPR